MSDTPLPLAQLWQSYAKDVLPIDAPEVQRVETQRAFYAGAWTLFNMIQRNLSPDTEPTAEDLAFMGALHAEMKAFSDGVGSSAETEAVKRLFLSLGVREFEFLFARFSIGSILSQLMVSGPFEALEEKCREAIKSMYPMLVETRDRLTREETRSLVRRMIDDANAALAGELNYVIEHGELSPAGVSEEPTETEKPFDIAEFMQKGGIVVPTICDRHRHDLIVEQLHIPREGLWRSTYAIACLLLFQGMIATDRFQKRLGPEGDPAAMNIVLAEIGCPACWNGALYRLVVRVMKRGFDHAAATSKNSQHDEDFARWVKEAQS